MSLNWTERNGVALAELRLAGRLDLHAAAALDELQAQRADPAIADQGLLLDLEGIDFCDSVGLGRLAALARQEQQAGRGFALCALQPPLRRLLEAVRLHRWFSIFDDADAARRWLAGHAAAAASPVER